MKIHAQMFFIAALIGSHYSVMADRTSECGIPAFISNIDARIVGGENSTRHSWPWQVSIRCSENNWQHRCGGSVLHPHWVITAAHCLHSKNAPYLPFQPSDLKIVLGEHNVDEVEENDQVFNVSHIEIHHDYRTTFSRDHDIALMRLEGDVFFNQYIKPICLPNVDVQRNWTCIVTGWGYTYYTNKQHSKRSSILQHVEVPVISRVKCNETDWYNGDVTENMICAGFPEGGKGPCDGDSGGPLACRSGSDSRWYLFGLTSWSKLKGCAEPLKPGIYTRVTRYLKWIQKESRQEIKTDDVPKKGTDGSSDSKQIETPHDHHELK